jgi:flagellar hook-associated protein 1 FlgK
MLDTGKRAMMNSQTALQTVGHNMANKSTEGYSRQRVEQQTNTPTNDGRLRVGTGSKNARVTRTNNSYLEKQIEKENSQSSFLETHAEALGRIEQIYNEQMNKGLGHYLGEFFNSFRELANSPESTATRTLVRENAQSLVQDFNRVHKDLTAVQEDLDKQVQVQLEEVNQITKEIASLNEKISSVEIQDADANDERDRRDLLLKKLHEKLDMTWGDGDRGQVSVTGGKVALLVSGFSSLKLSAHRTTERDRVEIFYENESSGQLTKITDSITGGSLGAALNVRDNLVNDLKSKTDDLAFKFATEVNKAHRLGTDLKGRPGSDFFELPVDQNGCSSNIKIAKDILKDSSRIVTGTTALGPADNTVANVISSIQTKAIMNNNSSTLDDYYNAQVGEIGVLAQRANKSTESQKNIVSQLQHIRESISGVSLDEEATKMIEFQKSFDASARLIRTADEMFDTILSLKRL